LVHPVPCSRSSCRKRAATDGRFGNPGNRTYTSDRGNQVPGRLLITSFGTKSYDFRRGSGAGTAGTPGGAAVSLRTLAGPAARAGQAVSAEPTVSAHPLDRLPRGK